MNRLFSSRAQWIWALSRNFREYGRRVLFRKSFELTSVPEKVELRIAADSRYMLYINGKFVNYGSERSAYNGTWPSDLVDIAPYLQPGKNVLAARVVNLTPDVFCQPSAFYGGLIFEAPEADIYSDTTVKACEAAGFDPDAEKMSFQYVRQEWADLNKMPQNWQAVDFDDSAWADVDFTRHSEAEPYGKIVERETPLFSCQLVEPVLRKECRWQGAGSTSEEPVALYCRENPDWNQHETSGNVRAEMLDFGRTTLGTILLEYENASGGETVDMLYTEAALSTGEPHFRAPKEWTSATASRVKLAPGSGSHELDMPVGLRYLVAVIRSCGNVKIKFSLRYMGYPWKFSARFHASEALLNDLYQMSVNTQLACASDTYTDCPWREQAQWWGDARIQAFNTFALCCDNRLLRRGIRMIGETESACGLTRAFAPATRWNTMIPDFSLCWILTIYDDYFQSGEVTGFAAQRQRIAQVLGYFLSLCNEDGLFQKDERFWNFYDWGFKHDKEPFPVLGNTILLYTLEKLEVLEIVSGMKVDFDHSAIGRLRQALRKFFRSDAGRKQLDEPRTAAYAIICGLPDEAGIEQAEKSICDELALNVEDNPTGASPYFIYYLFEAIKQRGKAELVIDCIRRRWGYWHRLGLTTTPESWATEEKYGTTSLCHAWSAHIPVQFRDILLGVTQCAPGWKSVRFAPVFAGVNAVSGVIPTPLGNISVDIDYAAGKKEIVLPEGITLIS